MTVKQRLEIRASEIRQRLAELAGVDELSDENRNEIGTLRTEYTDVEVRVQAATVAGDEPAPVEQRSEDKELAELRGKITLGNYVGAAMEMRNSTGAEVEYNAEVGLAPNAFPLEILAPEVRATTDTDAARTQASWLDRLFSETAAMALGVTFQGVAPGTSSHPITSAGASAAQRARSESATAASWTVGTTEIKPTRNAVRAVFSEEDSYRLPGLEDALRRDLGMALTEGVDRAVFKGDAGATGTDADITGIQGLSGITELTITQANKIKGPETLEGFVGLVDGIHAVGLSDLNVVAAIGAWRLWEGTTHNATADNQTIAQFLRSAGLSWRSRGDIEDATTNGKFAAFIGRGRGIAGAGVAAIWNSGMMIRDPYTESAKGEVAITMSHYWGLAFPRKASFSRVKFVS